MNPIPENESLYQRIEQRARLRKRILSAVIYSCLVIWALLVLFPFYWMLLTSVKSYGAYSSEFIPKFYTLAPTIANYVEAFTAVSLGKYFLNTVIFTLLTTALMLFITIPALNEGTVGIMVPVSAIFTLVVSRVMYKKGMLDVKKPSATKE